MTKKSLLTLSLIGLSACSLIPDYQRPAVDVPAAWSAPSGTDSASIAYRWWQGFSSPELDGLMEEALVSNNDLRAGVQRVEQARGILQTSSASLLPTVDATAGASRERATRPDSTDTNLSLGAVMAYELDLFGANRADVAASQAELEASQYDYEALKLIVMADVAQTYFNVLNARERLRIADDNLKNFNEVLRIVEARFEAGASDALDVSQQKSGLASASAARASIEQEIAIAENALAVLLGKPPQTISIAGDSLTNVAVPSVAPGQPSALLERRPDIKEAEALLIAANADIGRARAAMFPDVTLGVGASLAATGFGDPASSLIALSADALAPIFHSTEFTGAIWRSEARQRELAENYRKTVLVSFREVEDALAFVKASQVREAALSTAMQEARKSYELSKTRYESGTIDFQTLLDVQRTLLVSEEQFALSKNARLAASITLFRALGGGWENAGTP